MSAEGRPKMDAKAESSLSLQTRIRKLEAQRKRFITALDLCNARHRCNVFDDILPKALRNNYLPTNIAYAAKALAPPPFATSLPTSIEEADRQEQQLDFYEARLRKWKLQSRFEENYGFPAMGAAKKEDQELAVAGYKFARESGLYSGKELKMPMSMRQLENSILVFHHDTIWVR
ncbi:hypothetical protein BJ508DRAFT_315996 [Ascobolus immersus RN42]|uniref:Uncharacterized protein n=1 Tax=Ascobolus immersus RN42 TaxID=1160509 RepID=A0A3N4HMX8_ASCIM|nr:hypothetical protein BJ508DRAFT_315996 [Ascobolus immersus RN42]